MTLNDERARLNQDAGEALDSIRQTLQARTMNKARMWQDHEYLQDRELIATNRTDRRCPENMCDGTRILPVSAIPPLIHHGRIGKVFWEYWPFDADGNRLESLAWRTFACPACMQEHKRGRDSSPVIVGVSQTGQYAFQEASLSETPYCNGQKAGYRAALKVGNRIKGQGNGGKVGLMIHGPNFTGKTRICQALTNELRNSGVRVIWKLWPRVISDLERLPQEHKSVAGIVDELVAAPVLWLDSMNGGTPWFVEKLTSVLERRRQAGKPFLITSNMQPEQWKPYGVLWGLVSSSCEVVHADWAPHADTEDF